MAVFKPKDIFAGRYQLQKLLGLGGFSEVWQVIDQMAENALVALKIYAAGTGLDEDGIELFRREYALTVSLNHKHLLKPTYFDITEGSPYLVMPLCAKGSLTKKLFKQGVLSEAELAVMMSHVSDGLAYLHQRHPVVLHQDIKPDNVLITEKNEFLLSDFGISSRMRHTMMKSTRSTASSNSLTIAYAPPEKFTSRPKSMPASDIFSFGVMLYELCTNEVPWMGHGGQSLLTGSAVPEIPEEYSPELNQIVQACMNREPTQRPTAEQLHQLSLVYLDKGKWEGFEKITRYKADSLSAIPEGSATQTPTEGVTSEKTNTPIHKTEDHPDLQLDVEDLEGVDDNDVPVVRSERVTEAVDKKKRKAVAATGKRTFDRNVYMFLGAVMIVLVVLIGREYVQKNLSKSKPELMANNDTLAMNANDQPEKLSENKKNKEVKKQTTKNQQKAKDLQEQLRLMEEQLHKKNKKLKEKKQEESTSDVEELTKYDENVPEPPTPPGKDKPSFVITENGVIIAGKGKKGKNSINIDLPKEIIELVKDATKNAKSKEKVNEWSRKMSKKYEHLGENYAKDYMRKKAERERQRHRAHKRSHQSGNNSQYDYIEEYPTCFLIEQNNRWGYLDRKKKLIAKPQYESAWPFYEGLAAAKKYGKWGYINRYGKTVIPHKFDKPGHFYNGKAKVVYRGKKMYINRYGKCVQDCL
ncbi:protein kinase domain-containing protein [Microscilla marina]|uniref:non-specific serine/threonine protein kinase n=1 Tax=Microscilla marina ATCC 23134 TaxID=313606 RepID=A1ZW22_MICM2|nr:protein kinase [Microscilla marina]EAY25385.1 protein tyrosine kinase [Microscilla marina ATCC 23134]